jgi:hypothetical protein
LPVSVVIVRQSARQPDIMLAVASWRDVASQQAQDDLDGLSNTTLPFAKQMLEKSGEFFPFGATVAVSGETAFLAGDPGQGEHPRSTDVLSLLVDGLRIKRADLRAVATCFDVRLPDSDAVRVELEHQEGQALAVMLPYKKKRLGRGVEYGDLRAGVANKQVWT